MLPNPQKFGLFFLVFLCYSIATQGEEEENRGNPVKMLIASIRETREREWKELQLLPRNPFLGWDDARKIRRTYFGNDESFSEDVIDLFQNGDFKDRTDALDLISKCELQGENVINFIRDSFLEMTLEEKNKSVHLITRPLDHIGLNFLLTLLTEKTQDASLVATVASNIVSYNKMPGVSEEEQKEIVLCIGEALIPFLSDKRGYGVAHTIDMAETYPLYRGIVLALAKLGYTTPELSKKLKELFRKSKSFYRLDIAYAICCLSPDEESAFDFLTKTALTDDSEWKRCDAITYLSLIPQVNGRKSIPYLKVVLEEEKSNPVRIATLNAMIHILKTEKELS